MLHFTQLYDDWNCPEYDLSSECNSKSEVLVSYVDPAGNGWFWEVHLDSGTVFPLWDNTLLREKYGVK